MRIVLVGRERHRVIGIRARGLGDEDVPRRLPGFDQCIKKRHIEFHFERIFPEVRGIQPIFRILETSPDGEGKIIGADDKVLAQGEFDLFELDEERQMFRSSYLDRVMKSLEEKRKMDIENGKKGGRPKKVAKSAETPVSKGRKPTENQKRREEESKEEESKGSVSVVNNNRSNIETPSLVSRLADEGNHGPLQPVLPWEKLVDQLSTFQSYMELAGQHSGLGKLFVDHQKLILEIFKKHIRLYDKGAGLLFPEDVKRYFSNYIAAGSVTCRTLRETLLKELENTVDKDVNRFESVVDGRRTYLGHLIPVDAPPRPDASAVWDDVKKRWAH